MPIWPFNRKNARPTSLQLQDSALADLARMFLDCPEDPTPGALLRDVSRFDFTIDSLKVMDTHLEQMRAQELDDQAWNSFVLRAGAYVGEIIRNHTPNPNHWHWLDYKQAAERVPLVASLGLNIGTSAVLWDGTDGVIFPCAKVAKFLKNGPEDSTWFYAKVIIAGPRTA